VNRSLFALLLLLTLPFQALAEEKAAAPPKQLARIELADGDTLVFLGDSITHQCLYTQYVEDYFYTRYPERRIRFHNSGVGGDRASDALIRFDEDVAKYQPKYVSILLGMNDGSYTRFEPEVFARYEAGMQELLDRLDAIGAAAVPMAPTMFDSRAIQIGKRKTSELRDKYYNAVLAFYGAWLREQAFGRGLGYVDMYGPLNDITFEQRKTNPNFTMIPDAVHPGAAGQVVMAMAILSDMHPSRQVSGINAVRRGGKWVVGGQRGVVSDIASGETLKFTFTAKSLPWVLPESAALGYKLTKAGHKMSNERFRATGLPPGKYELLIDGQPVGVYSHVQLAAKVELQANPKTPQYQQALAVAMLNQERTNQAVRPLRNLWRTRKVKRGQEAKYRANPDDPAVAEFGKWLAGFAPKIKELEALAKSYEDKIYQANQPQPRTYELTPVK